MVIDDSDNNENNRKDNQKSQRPGRQAIDEIADKPAYD